MRMIIKSSPDTHVVLCFFTTYHTPQSNATCLCITDLSCRSLSLLEAGFFVGMKAPKVCYNRSRVRPLVSPLAEEEVYECSTVPWANTSADGHDLAVDLYPPIRAGSWAGHPGACGV